MNAENAGSYNAEDDGPWDVDLLMSADDLSSGNDNAMDGPWDVDLSPSPADPAQELREILAALSGPEAMADVANAPARTEATEERIERSLAAGAALLTQIAVLAVVALAGFLQ